MQYNILADCFTDNGHLKENKKWLAAERRFPKIATELTDSLADIVCLCEVDQKIDFIPKLLTELGYEFYWAKRRDDDMVVVAFLKDKFEYIKHEEIQHNDVAELFPKPAEGRTNDYKRGNCALKLSLLHKASRRQIQVIGTHLFWDSKREFVKIA
jgi:mRNA deadenylase 3'-5' endonuclease subunit Ccr4